MEERRRKVVLFLGGPGSGKGTQCPLLCELFFFQHISAGELMRQCRLSQVFSCLFYFILFFILFLFFFFFFFFSFSFFLFLSFSFFSVFSFRSLFLLCEFYYSQDSEIGNIIRDYDAKGELLPGHVVLRAIDERLLHSKTNQSVKPS